MSRHHRHPPHPNPTPPIPPKPTTSTDLKKHYLQLKEHAELLFDLLLSDHPLESDIDIIANLITKNTPQDDKLVDWAQALVENDEFKDIELNLADPILLLLVVVRQILAARRKESIATSMNIVMGTPTDKVL